MQVFVHSKERNEDKERNAPLKEKQYRESIAILTGCHSIKEEMNSGINK